MTLLSTSYQVKCTVSNTSEVFLANNIFSFTYPFMIGLWIFTTKVSGEWSLKMPTAKFTRHYAPVYNQYQTKSAKVLKQAWKQVYQEDSNDTPQPIFEFQESFPLLLNKPGFSWSTVKGNWPQAPRYAVGYHLNRLEKPVLMTVPKPCVWLSSLIVELVRVSYAEYFWSLIIQLQFLLPLLESYY